MDEVERLHRRRVWQPVEDGASIKVTNEQELLQTLEQMFSLTPQRRVMVEAQAIAYPLPVGPGAAAKKMAGFIQRYRQYRYQE
ncbi:hypothetical protein KW807_02485 [Candidatus Parcubacteria bacterium]|nr:hypothetical protein [Candidatus Parcubacteria bacterium]